MTNDNTKEWFTGIEFFAKAVDGEYRKNDLFVVKLYDDSLLYTVLQYAPGGSDEAPQGWTLMHGVVPIDISKVKAVKALDHET